MTATVEPRGSDLFCFYYLFAKIFWEKKKVVSVKIQRV